MADESNSGGAATNSGIEYQQHVSAWFMFAMCCDFQCRQSLGIGSNAAISRIRFESSDPIDDLVVEYEDHVTTYFQIKRQLALSADIASDFYKTVRQFWHQHNQGSGGNSSYVLVTTSDASRNIRNVLKGLLDSIRSDNESWSLNPSTKEQEGVLAKLKEVIQSVAQDDSIDILDRQIIDFLKSVYVLELDVDKGKSSLLAAYTILQQQFIPEPDLVWSILVKISLSYAAKRGSVTREALKQQLSEYKQVVGEHNDLDHAIEVASGVVQCGVDIVLVDWPEDDSACSVLELYRFGESGDYRTKFSEDRLYWGGSEAEGSRVLLRASTWTGFERELGYIQEEVASFSHINLMGANFTRDENETSFSRARAEVCNALVKARKEPHRCVHCERAVSEELPPLVEIDYYEEDAVGVVHRKCRKPSDRILGHLRIPAYEGKSYLGTLDIYEWSSLLLCSSQFLASMRLDYQINNGLTPILWNLENARWTDGDYCIEVQLEDGTVRHLMSRGKLDRFDKETAEKKVELFLDNLDSAAQGGDPACYSSDGNLFSTYSGILRHSKTAGNPVQCLSASVVRYTSSIGKMYPAKHFYAPLCRFIDSETGKPLKIGGVDVLISNILDIPVFLANWSASGKQIKNYDLRVIQNDRQFDDFVNDSLTEGSEIVIDPMVGLDGKFLRGFIIVSSSEFGLKA